MALLAGWEAHSASSVGAAIRSLEQFPLTDLTVVDVDSPCVHQDDLGKLRRHATRTAIVLVSSEAHIEGYVCERLRAVFLFKPFGVEDFKDAIRRAEALREDSLREPIGRSGPRAERVDEAVVR